ncbi:hypothetical protein BDV3_002762 [Batrachochytrium dendrobatidis]
MDAKFDLVSAALVGGIVATIVISIFTQQDSDIHPAILRCQSLASATRNPGESAVYRNKLTPHGTRFHTTIDGHSTAYNAFHANVVNLADREFIGYKLGQDFSWISFKSAADRVQFVGAGLVKVADLKPILSSESDPCSENMIGIHLCNSPEWLIIDYAAMSYGLVSVPIHPMSTDDNLKYIINHTTMKAIVVDNSHLNKILSIVPFCHSLKIIVVSDTNILDETDILNAKSAGINLITFMALETIGKNHPLDYHSANPKDVFTIVYTSGTTGMPKSVMLRHENLMSSGAGVLSMIEKPLKIGTSDLHLSVLSLSHIYERLITHTVAALGGKIVFTKSYGDVLADDIRTMQPTIFPTVPQRLACIYEHIKSNAEQSGFISKMIFDTAYAAKKRLLDRGIVTRKSIWDYMAFSKIQNEWGGKIKLIISGAAPVCSKTLQFLRIVFGVNVLEGYGLTETCGAGAITTLGDYHSHFGSYVGVPFSSLEFKLMDVSDMQYFATDENPRGEICLRGPTIMKGYFKDLSETDRMIEKSSGWMRTGDIGEILPNGTLRVIDRITNLVKQPHGEYIELTRLEQAMQSNYLSQLFIHADPLTMMTVAIGFPQHVELIKWAKTHGFEHLSLEQLCKEEQVKTLIHDNLISTGKSNNLLENEIPKAIHLCSEHMTVENGLLTETFCTKRFAVIKQFSKEIKAMYDDI